MPSIAQQDYLRPSGKFFNDCHLLAALAHNIEHGTIFDTVFDMRNEDDEREIDRVLSYNPDGASKFIYYCDTKDSDIKGIVLRFTQTQYDGLAAIQDAREDWTTIPAFNKVDGYLSEVRLGAGVIGIDGKNLAVTVTDGIITALSISNESAAGTDISWEDAQKLIGLPCTDLD